MQFEYDDWDSDDDGMGQYMNPDPRSRFQGKGSRHH